MKAAYYSLNRPVVVSALIGSSWSFELYAAAPPVRRSTMDAKRIHDDLTKWMLKQRNEELPVAPIRMPTSPSTDGLAVLQARTPGELTGREVASSGSAANLVGRAEQESSASSTHFVAYTSSLQSPPTIPSVGSDLNNTPPGYAPAIAACAIGTIAIIMVLTGAAIFLCHRHRHQRRRPHTANDIFGHGAQTLTPSPFLSEFRVPQRVTPLVLDIGAPYSTTSPITKPKATYGFPSAGTDCYTASPITKPKAAYGFPSTAADPPTPSPKPHPYSMASISSSSSQYTTLSDPNSRASPVATRGLTCQTTFHPFSAAAQLESDSPQSLSAPGLRSSSVRGLYARSPTTRTGTNPSSGLSLAEFLSMPDSSQVVTVPHSPDVGVFQVTSPPPPYRSPEHHRSVLRGVSAKRRRT